MWLDAAERDGSCGVRENLRLLPKNAHEAILDSLEGTHKYPAHEFGNAGYSPHRDEAPTASISTQRGR
jgi:phospholipid/cholesterol/gamma-HCH transport system ATP-binding protein